VFGGLRLVPSSTFLKRQSLNLEPNAVKLEGNYFEMGFQYGQKCRDSIRNCAKVNYFVTKYYSNLSREQCVKNVRSFLPLLEREVPNLYDEMRGIAQGARIGLDDIVVLNFHGRDLAGGCTMVHVDKILCEGNRSITGQTVDWTPSLAPYYHVVHRRPKKSTETIQFTLAGVLGLIGKNEYGLSVFMNILLTSEKITKGVPAYLLLRLAMEQKNLAGAVGALKGKKRASPFNYLISDSSGKACNVEASHEQFLPERISRGYYVHTNHCLNEPMKSADMYLELRKSDETLQRNARMRYLLGELTRTKRVDLKGLLALLSDHDNHPDSICRHPRENLVAEGRMCTVAAVLSREKEKGIWVAAGNPCTTEPVFYGFSS
jgi:isopenicillin-N N-acyltransferase-like protein